MSTDCRFSILFSPSFSVFFLSSRFHHIPLHKIFHSASTTDPVMSKTFAASDVASHNKPDNLYIIVDEDVYDLTKFQDEHPGGKKSE